MVNETPAEWMSRMWSIWEYGYHLLHRAWGRMPDSMVQTRVWVGEWVVLYFNNVGPDGVAFAYEGQHWCKGLDMQHTAQSTDAKSAVRLARTQLERKWASIAQTMNTTQTRLEAAAAWLVTCVCLLMEGKLGQASYPGRETLVQLMEMGVLLGVERGQFEGLVNGKLRFNGVELVQVQDEQPEGTQP